MASAIEEPGLLIRDIELPSEIRQAEALQREVWGIDDLDIVPLTILIATKEIGAILIGAFDGSSLVGFVYGFPGYEKREAVHHSHMLAVRSSYRNCSLGYKLKLTQRERVLAQGIKRCTWTFDPLQSLNAYFNIAKLGVVADTYKINFYGEATSSFLHQIGTDRLWVSWPLDSQRVRERMESETKKKASTFDPERLPSLLQVGLNNAPQRNELPRLLGREEHLLIEIPAAINSLQHESPAVALSWREATRWAFTEALASGYLVEEFFPSPRADCSGGFYLLSYGKLLDDFV